MIIAFNIAMILVALIVLFYLLEKDLGLILLSLVVFLQYIWMFFSLPVIESGIFINEQGRNGYFIYSGFILLLFYLSTILSLLVFRRIFSVLFKNFKTIKYTQGPLRDYTFAKILLISILLFAFINLWYSPIPIFSEDVSRFNFWDEAKFPVIRSLFGSIISFFGLGCVLIYRRNKKLAIALFIFYVIYLVLMDQKFTGFLICAYGMLVAFYYTAVKKPKFKIKWIFNRYVLVVSAVLFALIFYKYSIKNPFKYLGLSPIEAIFYRTFGLQAHLFWGTCEQYVFLSKPNTWDVSELWKGMHVLMLEFWPSTKEAYVLLTTRGVSWTNGYPPILIRVFPLPLALLLNFIFISFFALVQVLLKKFLENGSFILSMVFFQVLIWVNYTFTMGYFHKLLAPLIILVIYISYNFFRANKIEGTTT